MERVHDACIGLLKLLQDLHSVLGLLQLTRELPDSLKDHHPQSLSLDNRDDLLQYVVAELMKDQPVNKKVDSLLLVSPLLLRQLLY